MSHENPESAPPTDPGQLARQAANLAVAAASKPEAQVENMPDLGTELTSRDMFCLHGIALDSVDSNSILPSETTLDDRFRIAIEDRPALSANVHSSRATTSKAALWSSVGVLLNGGAIQAAAPGDLHSVMMPDGQRRTAGQSAQQVTAALDLIATKDAQYPNYPVDNEVVIQNPEIAGLYFKDTTGLMPQQINRNHTHAKPSFVPRLIHDLAEQFDLPIYAVRTSGVYEVKRHDAETGRYELTAEMTSRAQPADL